MARKELPIFFDQTGRRWRIMKWMFAGVAMSVIILASVLLPAILAPASVVPPLSARAHSVSELEHAFNAQNTPVLGRGQFIRAVEIVHDRTETYLQDVFSGKYIRALEPREIIVVAEARYALLRYGALPDKQIALTFDDGPDPSYSPRLLDLLAAHHAPSTFFVVGANVVKHPEIAQRMVREGHVLGNHTFSHIDFDFGGTLQGAQEINQSTRVITAATGYRSLFMRVPYAGATDQSLRNSIKGILQSQRLGYTLVAYDYDTRDWSFKAAQQPDTSLFDGTGKIVLLHDSGGDRSHTIEYVSQLLPMAKKAGYEFVNVSQVAPETGLYRKAAPTSADRAAFAVGQSFLVLPADMMRWLFALNVLLIFAVTGANIVLAFLQKRRRQTPRVPRSYRPHVSVIVPAYNEAEVLEASVLSVLRSRYQNLDVVIVDDGSRDKTLSIARRLASRDSRVRALSQPNRGKSAALNKGMRYSRGEIVICIDADTIFTSNTVWRLVRHFYDAHVGAVAGYVRVGNAHNWLTRWQSLEYITSITLERGAQAFLGAITVVPGACAAWRRRALRAAGGFSGNTLAEDCDVALAVHRAGYQIVQDMTAVSYTECPLTLGELAKQRFRWVFGNMQSYWKHRAMFFNRRYGWLGMAVLPNAALALLLPLFFWPLLLGMTIANILADRWWVIILFLAIIMVLQCIVAWIGLVLAREKMRHLLVVPFTRLVYGPLRTYILYRSLLTVMRGAFVGWNKLKRTNTVSVPGRTPTFRAVQQPAEE